MKRWREVWAWDGGTCFLSKPEFKLPSCETGLFQITLNCIYCFTMWTAAWLGLNWEHHPYAHLLHSRSQQHEALLFMPEFWDWSVCHFVHPVMAEKGLFCFMWLNWVFELCTCERSNVIHIHIQVHRIFFSYMYVYNRIEFMAFQDTDEQWWKTAIFLKWRIDAFLKEKNQEAALTKSAAFTAW